MLQQNNEQVENNENKYVETPIDIEKFFEERTSFTNEQKVKIEKFGSWRIYGTVMNAEDCVVKFNIPRDFDFVEKIFLAFPDTLSLNNPIIKNIFLCSNNNVQKLPLKQVYTSNNVNLDIIQDKIDPKFNILPFVLPITYAPYETFVIIVEFDRYVLNPVIDVTVKTDFETGKSEQLVVRKISGDMTGPNILVQGRFLNADYKSCPEYISMKFAEVSDLPPAEWILQGGMVLQTPKS